MDQEAQRDSDTDERRIRNYSKYLSSGVAHQILNVGAVLLYSSTLGATVGYSAVLVPQLEANSSSIPTDENMGSWIASLQSGVSPLGTVAGGICMDRWGRRFTMRAGLLPLILGYLAIAFSDSHIMVLIGRFITGIAASFSAAASSIVLCEIATPRVRGLYTSSAYTAFSVGILLVYILGSHLQWSIVAGLVAILPLLSFVAFLFVPESPVWLAKKGYVAETEMALKWLRGDEKMAKLELQELLSIISEQQEMEEADDTSDEEEDQKMKKKYIIHKLQYLLSPSIVKPFLIGHILNIFQILTGTMLVVFYAVDIISETNKNTEKSFNSFTVAQLTAFVRLVFVLVTNSLLYFIQRRTHAVISTSVCAGTALTLGCFLYFQSRTTYAIVPEVKMWISAVLILIFIAGNTCGFLALPATIMSEILPIKIRGAASGYIYATNDILQFCASKMYPQLKEALGAHGIFVVFGINSFLCSAFCYLFLPETQGKSLAQIEEYFRGQNILWIKRDKRLGRDYTRRKYFEMKKIGTKNSVVKYRSKKQNEESEIQKKAKAKLSVTFS